MRVGGIGRGWYEDEVKDIETNELQTLAKSLLKEKIDFIFKIHHENHLLRMNKNG
jgi:hypothetical protein